MKAVFRILALYPRAWRERYQEEMLALLEEYTITPKTIFDLLLGALDAQLDPSYRTKEGFMFQRFHDVRFLSYIYVCALAIFLVATNCWTLTIDSLTYWYVSWNASMSFAHDAPMGVTLVGSIIVMIICSLTLIGGTFSILRDAFKNRSFGIMLFALLCLGLSIVIAFPLLTDGWIVTGSMSLGIGQGSLALIICVSIFITGVKGLKLLRNRQGSLLIFAALIDFIVPSILLLYENAGLGQFDRLHSLSQFILYIAIGAIVLMLADSSFSRQSWRLIRGLGIFLALLMTAEAAIVVIWDVSCWIAGSGSIEIFSVSPSIFGLFGGQGLTVLIANVLILIAMLAFIIGTLLRAFIIHPNRRERVMEQLAV